MNAYITPFTVQVFISTALLLVCLANVIAKKDSDLQWEKTLIGSIFAYWISPPTQKK